MELSTIIPHLEAIVFASEKPLSTLELTDLVNNALGFIEDRASLDQVESALDAIREKYESEFYPFEVKQSGGGWQFLTKPVYHKTVAQLNGEKFLKRLSTAALETLSIIAYKQPVTKGEIENIRGVNCDYAVQKLLEKELIIITGRRENSPGQPLIYATSKNFMDYFGINSADDLPKLSDIVATQSAEATSVGEANLVDEDVEESDENTFVVTESGDIEEVKAGAVLDLDVLEQSDEASSEENELENTGETDEGLTEAELDEAVSLIDEAGDEYADEAGVDTADDLSGNGAADNENELTAESDEGLTEAELEEAIAEIEQDDVENETPLADDNAVDETADSNNSEDDLEDENKQKPDGETGEAQ